MTQITSLRLMCAIALGLTHTPVWADSLCAEKALQAAADAQVKVQVFDNEPGGCGFVSFDHVHMGAVRKQ